MRAAVEGNEPSRRPTAVLLQHGIWSRTDQTDSQPYHARLLSQHYDAVQLPEARALPSLSCGQSQPACKLNPHP